MQPTDRPQFDPSKNPVYSVERDFDAPRELVWKAWTDPTLVARWWGLNHFTMPSAKIDLRVGGKYLFHIRTTDGLDFWATGTYLEIEYPKKIVQTDSFGDEQGNVITPPTDMVEGDFPKELLITMTFEELAPNKTRFTLKHEGMPDKEQAEAGRAYWQESFDKLDKLLEEIC